MHMMLAPSKELLAEQQRDADAASEDSPETEDGTPDAGDEAATAADAPASSGSEADAA